MTQKCEVFDTKGIERVECEVGKGSKGGELD